MKNFVSLRLDREWHKTGPDIEQGTILEYLGSDHVFTEDNYLVAFKVIGKPVDKMASVEVKFV